MQFWYEIKLFITNCAPAWHQAIDNKCVTAVITDLIVDWIKLLYYRKMKPIHEFTIICTTLGSSIS